MRALCRGLFSWIKVKEFNELEKIVLARPTPSHIELEQKDDWVAAIRFGRFYRADLWTTPEILR